MTNPLVSWPVARATIRERGLTPGAIGFAILLLLVSIGVSSQNPIWRVLFSGPYLIFTVLLGAGLISSEVESGHAQLVLLRPITRAQWVGGRFAGAAAVLTGVSLLCLVAGSIAALFRADFVSPAIPVLWSWVPAIAWLATLLAIGSATSGWTNAGIAVAAYVGWNVARLILATTLQGWAQPLAIVDSYLGPQDLVKVPVGYTVLERTFWDLAWLCGCWLIAVRVFNLRELARRRA